MTDPDNLELKKRSRRRLVGAAALALLAAIVLPMVMDQEPRPSNSDVQVTIPDRNGTQPRAGVPAPEAAAPVEEEVAADVEPAPVAPPKDALSKDIPPKDIPPKDIPPRDAPAKVTPAIAPSAATHAESMPKPAPAPAPAQKPSPAPNEAARVQALLGDRPIKPAKPGSDEGPMVVQVGAFGDPVAAKALGAQLKAQGFTAYTEKAGTVTRVRVGPFASRTEAERAAERLQASGRQAVVTPR